MLSDGIIFRFIKFFRCSFCFLLVSGGWHFADSVSGWYHAARAGELLEFGVHSWQSASSAAPGRDKETENLCLKQEAETDDFEFFWKVFKLTPVSFLYFFFPHSSSQTDLITWLRSDICSCWDGGDFAAMPALLRSFIPIIRLPCVNEQHNLTVF